MIKSYSGGAFLTSSALESDRPRNRQIGVCVNVWLVAILGGVSDGL